MVSEASVFTMRSAGYRSAMMARAVTSPVATPKACRARPAMSQWSVGATTLTSAPQIMIESPPSTAARRPYRSETGPHARTPNANMTSDTENVACTSATLAPKYSRTDGSAGR